MRRHRALTATVAVALTAAGLSASSGSSRTAARNPRPLTIPALREWHGDHGSLRLAVPVRIAIPARYWADLQPTASVLANELRLVTRRAVRLARSGKPGPGEIELSLGSRDGRRGGEGYALSITDSVRISARTPVGVFYGTRTLLQLLKWGNAIPRGIADDWPRYPDRGLMIDLGRRSYPVSWIEAEIMELAYLKLNLLHLHLTDDQRWGIESDTHPEIVSPGALTKRQVREILATARRYHVTVVPEIDMPAHMGALLDKHPELELKAAATAPPPQTPESRKLDITNPAALHIVQQLLDEYLPLFGGPFWDIGADEYLMAADQPLYPQLQTFAIQRYGSGANDKDAILGFLNWVDSIVRAHHKTLRSWHDELNPGNKLSASPDILTEWWINFSPLSDPRPPTPQQLLAAGHRILNAGWFPTYYTEDLGPVQGKPDMRKAYESWSVNQFCGPTHDDQFFEACYVIGAGEARNLGATINVWDDHELTPTQIAAGIFPRLSVIAQKTWDSPALTPSYARFEKIMGALGRSPTRAA